MRFYHIADVHLGAVPDRERPYSEKRRQDLWDTFRDMIHMAVREKPDCLFVCGDLFHRQPLRRELKEVDYLFSLIPDTRVFLMAGNHDFAGEESAYRRFSWSPNVFFFLQEKLSAVRLELPEASARSSGIRRITLYGHSYQRREYREALYDRVLPLKEDGAHVLMAHGGDASHIPMDYGKIAAAGFDYVAMGHIHRPAVWQRGKLVPADGGGASASAGIDCGMAYAGSPEPLEVNDVGEHGFIRGEILVDPHTGERRTRVAFVPVARKRYCSVDIPVTETMTGLELEDRVKRVTAEDGDACLYRIVLTGERDPQWEPRAERLLALENVADVTDRTRPAWDWEALSRQYQGQLIGKFLEEYEGRALSDTEQLSRTYGLEALLAARGGEA